MHFGVYLLYIMRAERRNFTCMFTTNVLYILLWASVVISHTITMIYYHFTPLYFILILLKDWCCVLKLLPFFSRYICFMNCFVMTSQIRCIFWRKNWFGAQIAYIMLNTSTLFLQYALFPELTIFENFEP